MTTADLTFAQRILALGHARFAVAVGRPGPTSRATVSGHAQKSVALAIVASRGQVVSIETLADMACCSHDSAKRALNVLFVDRVVDYRKPIPPARRAAAYRINWPRVLALVPAQDLEAIAALTPSGARA